MGDRGGDRRRRVGLADLADRLHAAEDYYERVKHGKDAFLGSSAWGEYLFAWNEMMNARAAILTARWRSNSGRDAMSAPAPTAKPMPAATLRALKGSIKKWEAIVAGTGVDRQTDNCPLCRMFLSHQDGGPCTGCPVAERAGIGRCIRTPYEAWRGYQLACRLRITKPISAQPVRFRSRLTELAQAELDFLRSLLPEGVSS